MGIFVRDVEARRRGARRVPLGACVLLLGLVLAGTGARARADAARAPTAPPAAIEVIELTAQPIVAKTVRAVPSKLQSALDAAFRSLIRFAAVRGLDLAGPPLARYVSRGTATDPTFVVEAALPLVKRPTTQLPAGVRLARLPAGPAVTVLHRGRHADLPRAHAALDAWLAAHHRRAAGPRWEVYLTNPITTPDPDAQQTRVVAPIAAR